MNKELKTLCDELTGQIKKTYEEGITMEEAEKLAAKFLYAQILLSTALKVSDLDSRMKKTGLKAVKAAVYMDEATKGDKKPSDTFLSALVDKSVIVSQSQTAFDEADADKEYLQNYFNIFKEAHIHFRGISKGRFE